MGGKRRMGEKAQMSAELEREYDNAVSHREAMNQQQSKN